MNSAVSLVIFEGGASTSELEKMMVHVRKGIVIDLLHKAQAAGFTRIILVTNYRDLAEMASGFAVEIEYQSRVTEEFHFGTELLKLIKHKDVTKVLYMGGAAAPLISVQELSYLRSLLESHENAVIANNYYSADIVGFTPASALEKIVLPPIDNTLPQLLVQQSGLKYIPTQRTLGLQFDLDTPADLMILANHPSIGTYTKQAIADTKIDIVRCLQIKEVMQTPHADLVVYGRVNAAMFKLLDELTKCRIRLYSEERGLKALGRDTNGQARSLIGEIIALSGYDRFFQFLASICQGAVLDTRVLFSHFRWELSQSDRFYSDLGMADQIIHPQLREFTRAANRAAIPVLLGGHSLVTGGLWALLDAAYWDLSMSVDRKG